MLDALSGSNPADVYCSVDNEFGLGHRQLAAFVPADGARRSYGTARGITVALDGCVTNAGDVLRERCVTPVVRDSEPDAVRLTYDEFGVDCLSELDGPFTLALWDEARKRLLLSRDRLGEKSIYYFSDPTERIFLFASEIGAILAHPSARPRLDLAALSLYLSFGYIPGERTLFEHVHKLLPGERLVYEQNRFRREKYWRLPAIRDEIEDELYCIRRLRELFLETLEGYVNRCPDPAVLLSGGVDSTIIVAGLRELGVPRIPTFAIGFDLGRPGGNKTEDLRYAADVARTFATEHHALVVRSDHELNGDLVDIVRDFDDLVMTPNTYSKSLLVQAVRDAGFNSLLTGSAAAGACGVHRKFLNDKKREKLLKTVAGCETDAERYYVLRSRLFSLDQQRDLLVDDPRLAERDIVDVLGRYIDDIKSDDFFRLFLFSNLAITAPEKTMRVLDQSGRAAGVEVRSPYVDRALVEFSTQLPASFDGGQSYASMKTHLRKGFENVLPGSVLDRPVIGYPSYYWNNGELAPFRARFLNRGAIDEAGIFRYDGVRRILEEEELSDAKSAGKHQWALTQFSLWHELHIQSVPVRSMPHWTALVSPTRGNR